ncbi:MAG: hypothetical protein HY744_20360 [Deltaproteobacteria bacterium]|nr:hypothetical protein [Deltaproteobacteria bacterium]
MRSAPPAALALLLVAAVAAAVGAGCGGARPPAQAPLDAPGTEAPADFQAAGSKQAPGIEGAAQDFDAAERQLGSLLGGEDRAAPAGRAYAGPPAQRAAPAAPAEPPSPAAEARPEAAAGSDARDEREDRCALACRALASMERAAGRLCALAGDADARCASMRARVGAATELVRGACPRCYAAPP